MPKTLLAFVAAAMVCACPLTPAQAPVEPDYPAADGFVDVYADDSPEAAKSPCGRSCDAFRKLSCPEGQPNEAGVSCYRVCTKAASLRRLPVTCWTTASSVAALRACGGIRCVP